MKIMIDSREQLPLKFRHDYITEVIVQKLDVGDYGVEFKDGHRPPFYFDRKSIPDLYGTMTNGYERFKDCIRRSRDNNTTLFIIIEGTLSEVLQGTSYSSFSGTSLVYKLFTIWIKYGVQSIFVKDRKEMSEYITQFYISVGKQYVINKKKEETALTNRSATPIETTAPNQTIKTVSMSTV